MSKQVIFDKKNILVAGGAGFVGSHLCDELVKEHKVICIDNFSSGTERNIDHLLVNPNFVLIDRDLSKPLDLTKIKDLEKFKVEFQGVQEIYNLACPMSANNFLDNRIPTLLANSYVLNNLLNLAVKYQAKFFHFSSSVVYGPRDKDNPQALVKESDLGKVDQLSKRAAYDEGKRFAETMVDSFRAVYHLDTKIIRLFRVYGPRMKYKDGQLIPDYINNALENKDIVINGDETFSSSFCYISDVIDALMNLRKYNQSGVFNIGSDIDVNLTDLVKIIIRETKSQSSIKYSESDLFITELALPDIRLAKDILSWLPVVTLENGLKKTIFDLQAHKRLHGLGD